MRFVFVAALWLVAAIIVGASGALQRVRPPGLQLILIADQPAKLMFVSAQKGTAFAGTDTIKLIFTEKDHSKDERPDLKALFGNYGSALMIGIKPDGKVVTCDIAHEALTQKSISSPSSVKMSEFKNENGQISGKLVMDGKQEAFGQTWEVNLTFKTKVP